MQLADETSLHDHKTQEQYHQKIIERYMKLCSTSSSSTGNTSLDEAFNSLSLKETSPLSIAGGHTAQQQYGPGSRPPLTHRPSETFRENDLPNILLAMRKLREGIYASRRKDVFAQRAYMFIIHASILSRSWESYQPALLYLLDSIHPITPLSPPELREFTSYRILDLACRQYELTEALTLKSQSGLRDRRVISILQSLIHDDWVKFWRLKRAVDGYQRVIMEFAQERMRLHALKCLGRSYHHVEKAFVERSGDAGWAELVKGGVGWELQENGVVVIRKVRAKGG